jgi:hypothetical protein
MRAANHPRLLCRSRSGVYHLLRPPKRRRFPVRCPRCGVLIRPDGNLWDAAGALCLGCPAKATATPLAEWVRAYRVAVGLSQRELARRAGVAVRVIAYLETGRRASPRPATLARLAAVLGDGLVAGPPAEEC